MQVKATAKNVRISPQKARLAVDQIRGKSVAVSYTHLTLPTIYSV